jgi:hypothetical protein
MLSSTQCRMIQAPDLVALLPKLHLNRHTPHAVIFAGPLYSPCPICTWIKAFSNLPY